MCGKSGVFKAADLRVFKNSFILRLIHDLNKLTQTESLILEGACNRLLLKPSSQDKNAQPNETSEVDKAYANLKERAAALRE